jgi:hypothetical protein
VKRVSLDDGESAAMPVWDKCSKRVLKNPFV